MGGKLDIGPLMIDAELAAALSPAALSPAAHCPTVPLWLCFECCAYCIKLKPVTAVVGFYPSVLPHE